MVSGECYTFCDDASVDRLMWGLERREENLTVNILDRLAAAFGIPVAELFIIPAKDASPPEPLRKGRKPAR